MVDLSTTKVEYMASTHASKESIWLRRLCFDIGVDVGKITICCDSQSAIFLQRIQLSMLEQSTLMCSFTL